MFVPNKNAGHELSKTDEFNEMRRQVAAGLVKPVQDVTPGSGAASKSLTVVETGDGIGVGSTDPFWHLIEWGSVNNPPYAPLRRGIRAAGLRLEESQT